MLDRKRQELHGKYYDYIFIVLISGVAETHILDSIELLNYHVKLAKCMKQTYTAYTWNEEHSCYVQSSCYPTCPMPCLA